MNKNKNAYLNQKSRKLVIWDFNGVIDEGRIDGLCPHDFLWERINNSLKNEGWNVQLSKEDCYKLYGEDIEKFYEHVKPNKPKNEYKKIIDILIKSDKEIPLDTWKKYLTPTPGLYDVLNKTLKKNYKNLLLSSVPNFLLEKYLECIKLNRYFSQNKYSKNNPFSDLINNAFAVKDYNLAVEKNKANVLTHILNNNLIHNYNGKRILKYDKIIIIGDSPKDIKLKDIAKSYLKKQGKIFSVQYTHPKLEFKEDKNITPDYKIRHLDELLKII